jgi:hypothetical protein
MECRRLIEMRSDCLSGNRVSVVTLVLDHYFIISAGLLLRQPLGPIRSLPCQRFLERHGNASSIDELRPWSSAYYARTAHPARSACRHRRAHVAMARPCSRHASARTAFPERRPESAGSCRRMSIDRPGLARDIPTTGGALDRAPMTPVSAERSTATDIAGSAAEAAQKGLTRDIIA